MTWTVLFIYIDVELILSVLTDLNFVDCGLSILDRQKETNVLFLFFFNVF